MAMTQAFKQYANRRLRQRLYRSMPWIGSVVALATLGMSIRRKGVVGGTLHAMLDAVPYVGGAKNILEIGRGRDLFPDRARPSAAQEPRGPLLK
jgi:hypothetical protein